MTCYPCRVIHARKDPSCACSSGMLTASPPSLEGVREGFTSSSVSSVRGGAGCWSGTPTPHWWMATVRHLCSSGDADRSTPASVPRPSALVRARMSRAAGPTRPAHRPSPESHAVVSAPRSPRSSPAPSRSRRGSGRCPPDPPRDGAAVGTGVPRSASTSWAPSRSWTLAGWTTTVSSSPSVSTRMCRLRPLTFLPPSYPWGPPCSVVLTDWLSMMAALGSGSRLAYRRTRSRRTDWIRFQVWSRRQRRK